MTYAKRSVKEVKNHNGRIISLGKYSESVAGDMSPRQVFILVEWASKDAFDSYCNDPALADLHPHRENGTKDYIWQLFDKIEDLRPIFN
ncbi:MAG: DUF1330 domain-containing protein [Cycloclasticus sp.]